MARWRLKSPASRLFTQPFIQSQIKENIKAPRNWPTQRPVTRSFDIFFALRLNKPLSKQSWGWWFETSSRSLWRQCNGIYYKLEISPKQQKVLENCVHILRLYYVHRHLFILPIFFSLFYWHWWSHVLAQVMLSQLWKTMVKTSWNEKTKISIIASLSISLRALTRHGCELPSLSFCPRKAWRDIDRKMSPHYWPFVRETISHRWIPLKSDVEHWCFLDVSLSKYLGKHLRCQWYVWRHDARAMSR